MTGIFPDAWCCERSNMITFPSRCYALSASAIDRDGIMVPTPMAIRAQTVPPLLRREVQVFCPRGKLSKRQVGKSTLLCMLPAPPNCQSSQCISQVITAYAALLLRTFRPSSPGVWTRHG